MLASGTYVGFDAGQFGRRVGRIETVVTHSAAIGHDEDGYYVDAFAGGRIRTFYVPEHLAEESTPDDVAEELVALFAAHLDGIRTVDEMFQEA
jgi:ferric iron reductase protein FhuF